MTIGTSGRAARIARNRLEPLDVGEDEVEHHEPEPRLAFRERPRPLPGGRGEHRDPVLAQQRAVHLQGALLVVDEEDLPRCAGFGSAIDLLLCRCRQVPFRLRGPALARLRRRETSRHPRLLRRRLYTQNTAPAARPIPRTGSSTPGSQTRNTAPPPGRFAALMRPPCPSTIPLAIDKPRPVPLFLVVRNGSKITGSSRGSIPGPSSATEIAIPPAGRPFHPHRDAPFPAPRLDGVARQIFEDLPQLEHVAPHPESGRRGGQFETGRR